MRNMAAGRKQYVGMYDDTAKGDLRQTIYDWTRNRGSSPRLYPGSLIWCVRKEGRDLRTKVEALLAWRIVQRDCLDGTLAGEFEKSDSEEIEARLKVGTSPSLVAIRTTTRSISASLKLANTQRNSKRTWRQSAGVAWLYSMLHSKSKSRKRTRRLSVWKTY